MFVYTRRNLPDFTPHPLQIGSRSTHLSVTVIEKIAAPIIYDHAIYAECSEQERIDFRCRWRSVFPAVSFHRLPFA